MLWLTVHTLSICHDLMILSTIFHKTLPILQYIIIILVIHLLPIDMIYSSSKQFHLCQSLSRVCDAIKNGSIDVVGVDIDIEQ